MHDETPDLIVSALAEPKTISAVATELGVSVATVRKHVAHLHDAGKLSATGLTPGGRGAGRPAQLYKAA